ncbi:hypothetical protein BV22DRAFT_1108403 [Leucogyrophana mollusca]|uniref:Uncharacterized protein n=1 Tax=Leucogyrophana mollusca TaxID=85980 RepID=A0ACB8AZG8_9AGAM|nr:hypothetical protein BV22DRAFT_1108403 [Leucogyrophana mollusca]
MLKSFLNRLTCTHPGCSETFISQRGRTKHIRTYHRNVTETLLIPPTTKIPMMGNDDHEAGQNPTRRGKKTRHPYLYGAPCDHNGNPIPPGTPPPPRYNNNPNDWAPFTGQGQFLLADFLFRKVEMSAPNIDYLMELWAFEVTKYGGSSPFSSHRDAYQTIDSIQAGDVPWQCLSVWFRDPDTVIKNMLDNPDFDSQFDYVPYVYTDSNGQCRWSDVMSGNFAWHQCVSYVVTA